VPDEDIPAGETRFLQAFATVTARILRGLGGDFTRIADDLERGQRTHAENAFLARFTPRTTPIEIGRLTILEGEAETEFITLREQCASLNLEDGDLYELQLTALESGIEELGTRTIFIYNRIAERQNLPEWSGETVFVDRHGEIIKSQPVTAKYYEEEIPFEKGRDQPPQELTRIKMLLIPGGTLLEHGKTIYIKPFFMGQTPITRAQWWAIAGREDLKIKNNLDLLPSYFKEDYQETSHWLRPVEQVSWHDAIEFCGRLAKLTGSLYALPSETQWEYACRGFRQPPDSYPPFHYGETLTGKLANYGSLQTYADEEPTTGPQQTTPVGNYPPNAFGLQDMHGNVWEWCLDLWSDEEISIAENASLAIEDTSINLLDKNITMQLLSDNGIRAIRGGSWLNYPRDCRCAVRSRNVPAGRDYYFGFRVVCRFPRL
jgi:formylglycine-generating enzyme required for sulfatase activity